MMVSAHVSASQLVWSARPAKLVLWAAVCVAWWLCVCVACFDEVLASLWSLSSRYGGGEVEANRAGTRELEN